MVLGLRRSEIAALTWDDLDRTRQELRITKQAGRRLGDPPQSLKSTASNRTLPLPASFVAFIDAHGDLDAPTICTRAGKAWLPDTITDEWTAWTGKPKGWTFHDLRHGAAGLIAAATGNVLAVKSVLGHGSVDMTTIYTAESASRMDSAMQAIETALFGRRGSS
jgi:integrase